MRLSDLGELGLLRELERRGLAREIADDVAQVGGLVATQGLISHHFWIDDRRTDRFSIPFRYVWPSELDLMARLAGMTLRERWSGWKREPFTSESTKHVSVWQKPASRT